MARATADACEAPAPGGLALDVETAPAKINLALHVLGRRPDGYHDLDTLVVFAEHGDRVTAEPGNDPPLALDIDGPFAPLLALDESKPNLVRRAAGGLAAASPGVPLRPVRLRLTKQIPVASGLGGGSADAAATLRLLDRFWGLGASRARLAEIGLQLGADVPLCLVSRPLRAGGIGERITPASGIPALPMVLVHPGMPLATAAVFARLEPRARTPLPALPARFASPAALAEWLRGTRNDLFAPASAEAAIAGTVVAALSGDADCLLARMSGSGAAAFGIFATAAAAERAVARLRAAEPDWWVRATRTGGSVAREEA